MFFVPGANLASSALRFAALGAAFLFVLNWLKTHCGCIRKWDIRKIPGVRKLFLKLGIDEYPDFYLIVTVHSIKDLATAGKFYVYINAKYEYFQTRTSTNGKYEQTAKLLVPQGADELVVGIYGASAVMQDVHVGSAVINVGKFLGPLAEEYLGKKKPLKVVSGEGATAGVATVTFRKADASSQLEAEVPLVAGLDPDQRPALYGELLEFFSEESGVFVRKNLKHSEKLQMLAKVLHGKLTPSTKGVFSKKSVDAGNYWAVVELDEDQDSPDSASSSTSGQARQGSGPAGTTGGRRKWYLASYESNKEFLRSPDNADMTIPLLAVTSVHKVGDASGGGGGETFSVRFVDHEDGKKKKEIFFKVGPGRDVDVWVDGLELFREELREMKVLGKQRKEEWARLSETEKMNQWMQHYRSMGYSEEELKKYYQQYQLAQMSDQQRLNALKAAAKQQIKIQ